MTDDLILVFLNDDQRIKAKEANGKRKQISHALVVGGYGVMYGTEKQCRKYYSVWKDIFNNLFDKCYETSEFSLEIYISSGNVVMDLIAESDRRKEKIVTKSENPRKKEWLSRIFG